MPWHVLPAFTSHGANSAGTSPGLTTAVWQSAVDETSVNVVLESLGGGPFKTNAGSTAWPLLSRPPFQYSKCRCAPVDAPLFPMLAMCWPSLTVAPCRTRTPSGYMWPYTVETSPVLVWESTTIHCPKPL